MLVAKRREEELWPKGNITQGKGVSQSQGWVGVGFHLGSEQEPFLERWMACAWVVWRSFPEQGEERFNKDA